MFSELLMKTVRQRQEKDIGLETCDRQLARVNALSCIYPVTHTKLELQIPAHSLAVYRVTGAHKYLEFTSIKEK